MTTHRILVVDDEPRSLEFLARLLKENGFEVYLASSGVDALKAMQKTAFDLLLLDVHMPRMSGHEVAVAARTLEGYATVPILFLSGSQDPDHILEAFRAGAQDYVCKPFCDAEVLARVRCHLDLRDARVSLEELVRARTAKLERKTVALEEILESLEDEKERIRLSISERVETLVKPVIEKLRVANGATRAEHVELLVQRLDELFAPYAPKLVEMRSKLTAQEFEIATLIRNGASTKVIADSLSISPETVKWHRANIRRKLGIDARSENLATHLAEMK